MTRLVSNIWDRIGTLTPTRDAAVAMSGGESYEVKNSGGHVLFAPPRMRPFSSVVNASTPMVNLTGRRFGALTVLGLKDKEPSDGKCAPARWVCRCVCGNYTMRRHDKLAKKPADADEACPECDQRRRMIANDKSAKGTSKAARKRENARLDAMAAGERFAPSCPSSPSHSLRAKTFGEVG